MKIVHPLLSLCLLVFFSTGDVGKSFGERTDNKSESSENNSILKEKNSLKKKYLLRYEFTKGDTLRWEVVHRVKFKTTIQAATDTVSTSSKSIKVWKISDVDAQGNVTFEHSIESVDMWEKISGRDLVRYNSKTDKKPPNFKYYQIAKMIGVPMVRIKMDRRGKVLKRTELVKGKTARNFTGRMTILLPSKPKSVGQKWAFPQNFTVNLENGGTKSIKGRRSFTFKAMNEQGVATIDFQTEILISVNNPKIQYQLMSYLTKGSIQFDTQAGRILNQTINTNNADDKAIGFQGANSLIHYITKFTEKFLTSSPDLTAQDLRPEVTEKAPNYNSRKKEVSAKKQKPQDKNKPSDAKQAVSSGVKLRR